MLGLRKISRIDLKISQEICCVKVIHLRKQIEIFFHGIFYVENTVPSRMGRNYSSFQDLSIQKAIPFHSRHS